MIVAMPGIHVLFVVAVEEESPSKRVVYIEQRLGATTHRANDDGISYDSGHCDVIDSNEFEIVSVCVNRMAQHRSRDSHWRMQHRRMDRAIRLATELVRVVRRRR